MYNNPTIATTPVGGVVAYTGTGSAVIALATAAAFIGAGLVLGTIARHRRKEL